VNHRELLEEALGRLFRDHLEGVPPGRREWSASLWAALESSGLTTIGVPVSRGGSGGSRRDALVAARVAARWRAPVPLGDSNVAAALLAEAGGDVPAGPLAVVGVPDGSLRSAGGPNGGQPAATGGTDVVVRATVDGVPWARIATHLVVVGDLDGGVGVALVPTGGCEIVASVNLAGEPRDTVRFRDTPAVARPLGESSPRASAADVVRCRGALVRAAQMVGALDWVLEATIGHARDRQQFGQPLSAFQAVQHHVAVMAGEVARAAGALDLAMGAIEHGDGDLELAVARITAGEAATVAARLAHQVHGAVGYTLEHPLHEATRRLWAWRDEYDDETTWSVRLGRAVVAAGPDRLWPTLTRSPGPRAAG
jgi:acyl-CoA dehydrogenase